MKPKIFQVISSVFAILVLAIFISGIITAFAWNPFGGETPEPVKEEKTPELKLYSQQKKVLEAGEITKQNLKAAGNAFDGNGGARSLYDGDESTATGNQSLTWVVLDAGKEKSLWKIRFLPGRQSQKEANSSIGTRFYASADNKEFFELGCIEPDLENNLNMEWHEILFSGYGTYRYFKVELPPGASLAEVEWIADEGVKLEQKEKKSLSTVGCTAFDAQRAFDGLALFAVYNAKGVMTHLEMKEIAFQPGEYQNLEFIREEAPELGGEYRVLVIDDKAALAVRQPLSYRYTRASGELKLPNVFSDNMLLQADQLLTIWGKAPCGETVDVVLTNSETGDTAAHMQAKVVDPSGWELEMGSFPPGGTYRLNVFCGEQELEFKDITFGDVWMFMGQSNMEYYMLMGADTSADLASADGIKRADNPQIRILNLWNKGTEGTAGKMDNVPLDHWDSFWAKMNVDHANYCSAIAYYFSQEINYKYQVPVGILNVAVGDTEIDWWMPSGEKHGAFTGQNGKLYNNRIYPFVKLKIKGVLMYQGEADEYRTHLSAEEYSDALAGMVDSYRKVWGENLPFYWAQVTRYQVDETLVREGQRLALNKIENPENAGMVCLLDQFGNYEGGTGSTREDIHPMGKKEVAMRFVNYAARDLYGKPNIAASGPSYESMEIVGNTVELTFAHTGALAVMPKAQYADHKTEAYMADKQLDGTALQEFWIAGVDGYFLPAKAEIDGDRVIVWNDEIDHPVHVRYAWGDYPEMPNLTDGSGLPASSFTTENQK